jgi:integrase
LTAAVRTRRSTATAERALAALDRHLDAAGLAAATVRAYRRQCRAYVHWVVGRSGSHPKAFTDRPGAETAVAAWRRHLLLTVRARPAGVNQGLAAVTKFYEQGLGLPITVRRARVTPHPPAALTPTEQNAVERAALRRGERDAAIIAVLLRAGARADECARLEFADVTPEGVRLRSASGRDRVAVLPVPARARLEAWLSRRGTAPGRLFPGQRGPLSVSGITQVVLAVGEAAGLPGLRPQRLRHTWAAHSRR